MPSNAMNIGAGISVQEFYLTVPKVYGSIFSVSGEISLKAYGPEGTATIESLEYSVDGASGNITLIGAPTAIAVGPGGVLTNLVWDLKEDFDTDFYNKDIKVTATMSDGVHVSPKAYGSLYIKKELIEKSRDPINNSTTVGSKLSINDYRRKN